MSLTSDAAGDLAARMNVSRTTALRYLRKTAALPDGRQIDGHAPGVAG